MKIYEGSLSQNPSTISKHARTHEVIGAGVSGVVTARILVDEGVSVTVLEKTHEIGGVWSENYVGFGIQTPVGLSDGPRPWLAASTSDDFAPADCLLQFSEPICIILCSLPS